MKERKASHHMHHVRAGAAAFSLTLTINAQYSTSNLTSRVPVPQGKSRRPQARDTASAQIQQIAHRQPHPNMGECRQETFSDGKPAFSVRSKLCHLVDPLGKSGPRPSPDPRGGRRVQREVRMQHVDHVVPVHPSGPWCLTSEM